MIDQVGNVLSFALEEIGCTQILMEESIDD